MCQCMILSAELLSCIYSRMESQKVPVPFLDERVSEWMAAAERIGQQIHCHITKVRCLQGGFLQLFLCLHTLEIHLRWRLERVRELC